MRLLLDSHVILWWLGDSKRISDRGRELIENEANDCFISAASIWELEIKAALGKLTLPERFYDALGEQDFIELVITHAHARALRGLPDIHRDPFDRLLVAQSLVESLTLVTSDEEIVRYDAAFIRV